MLQLEKKTALVDSVNTRAEKHGEETKVAFDVFLSLNTDSKILGLFDTDLRKLLFCKPGEPPQAELLPDSEQEELRKDPEHLPALRFPKIEAIKWIEKFPGYRIDFGVPSLFDDKDLSFLDVELDRFSFAPHDGGSVAMRFRAIIHPTPEQMAPLISLIQQKAEISLIPPAPPEKILDAVADASNPDATPDEKNAGFAEAAAGAIAEHEKRTSRRPKK